jgi:DUF2971 family protein
MRKLGGDITRYTKRASLPDHKPDILLHFTDIAGLVGILKDKVLWASLATALNDASETKIGPELFDFAQSMAMLRSRFLTQDFLRSHFETDAPLGSIPSDYRTYVTSLCSEDASIHWMHYGRSGTGVALELDTTMLSDIEQFTLCKVLYDGTEQVRRMAPIVQLVDDFLERSLEGIRNTEVEQLLKGSAASMLHSFLRLAAPQMKDGAFTAEDEWRILSVEAFMSGKPYEATRPTKFRVAATRLVPYKEITIPADAIRGIVLGYSCSLRDDEQALRVLMDECLGRRIPVRRSAIAVRP